MSHKRGYSGVTQALITNAALLISLSTLYGLLNFIQDRPRVKKILTGILFGGTAIIAMMVPFRLSTGIIYDGRSIVLTLAGLFGGGTVALIAAVLAGIYRFSLGGPGIWAGVATIIACSLVGLFFRRLHKNQPEKIKLPVLYLVGVISHLAMLACQLLLPWPRAFEIISEIWLPILLIFPLATFLIGIFVKNEEDRYQTHVSLRSSQSMYRDLVETAQDLIWECDIEGRYTYLNPAWEDVFGYKIDEMLGKKFTDFQTPEYAERDSKEFVRLLQGNTIRGFETVHIGKDGQEINLVFNAKFLKDNQGNTAGSLGTAYDITQRKQAENELKLISARNEAILGSVPDIIMEVDNNKVYTWANSVGKQFFGEDVIGKGADYYFEGEQDTYSIVQPLFEGDDSVVYVESWQRRQDGEKRLLGWWCRVLKDEYGKPVGALSTARDITERKMSEEALKESEQKFRSLFNSMNEMVVLHEMIYDPSGNPINYRILDCNPMFTTITGIQPEDAVGFLATDVYKTDEAPYMQIYAKVAQTGKPVIFVTYFPPMEKHFSISIFSPKPGQFATVSTDITEQRKAEDEIYKLNLELEERVADRTRSLQIANSDLESFSYSVSHDLRTPLRAINGFAEIINRRHRDDLNAEGQHYIENIIEASNRMSVLIDDLLKYSRLGRSGIRHEAVNLNDVMAELAGDLQAIMNETKGVLSIPADLPTVIGDKTLLSQVFSNLIDNGLKYHEAGKNPHVQISSRQEGETVIVAVKDNGIGIPIEFQEKIFAIFQRLHSTEEYPGVGIGLSIVKKALDLMGGSIHVESSPNKGSTFFVALPKE